MCSPLLIATALAVLLTVAGTDTGGVATGEGEAVLAGGGGGDGEGLRRITSDTCCSERSAEQRLKRPSRAMVCSWRSTCRNRRHVSADLRLSVPV